MHLSGFLKPLKQFGCWAPSTRCERSGRFYADYEDVEVIRMATRLVSTKVTAGEGGARGCFFFDAPGSGIVLNVGRSLRSIDRASAARALGIDVPGVYGGYVREHYHNNRSMVPNSFPWMNSPQLADLMIDASEPEVPDFWRAVGNRFFDVNPWHLDFVSCAIARRVGYDTLQYPYRERHLRLIELVSCRNPCYHTQRFSLTGACVGGLRGVNGGDCPCDETRGVLNCGIKHHTQKHSDSH